MIPSCLGNGNCSVRVCYHLRNPHTRALGLIDKVRWATHFRTMTHIANRLPVLELTRPASGSRVDALADQVEARLAEDQR